MMHKIRVLKLQYLNEKAQGIIEYALVIFFVVSVAIYLFYPVSISIEEDGRPVIRKLILSIQNIFEQLRKLISTVSIRV